MNKIVSRLALRPTLLVGAIGLALLVLVSPAAASDVTLAAALEEQFAKVEADARAALRARPARQLAAYTKLNRDVAAAIKEIKAEDPVTDGGDEVKACELASHASFQKGARSGIKAAKAFGRGKLTEHRRVLRTAKAQIATGDAKHDDCLALGENPQVVITAWGVENDLAEFEFTETIIRIPDGTVPPGGTISGCGDNLAAVYANADFTGVRPGLRARFVWRINGAVFADFEFENDRYATSAGGVTFFEDLRPMPNGLYELQIFIEGVLEATSSVTRAC
jgi:hypothetical protein